MNESFVSIVLLAALVPLCGALIAITPWLMRRNECFAVTVPAAAQGDPRLVGLKKRYSLIMGVLTLLATVAVVACMGMASDPITEGRFLFIYTAALLVPVVAGVVLMLVFRRRVQAIKAQEGWAASASRRAAVIAETGIPKALPLVANLAYVPVIALGVVVALAMYDHMPDAIPMHFDMQGNVNSTAPKSIATALIGVWVSLFLATCMVFVHWSIGKSKPSVDASAPMTSALAYGMFARAQSIMLLAMGLLLCLTFELLFPLSTAGVVSGGATIAIILLVALVVIVAAVGVSIVYGQAGSRVFARMQASDDMPFDDDRHWKLGIFYVNPDDPSVFLPERFGIGWTVNLARPATWAILAGFTVVTAVFVIAICKIAG